MNFDPILFALFFSAIAAAMASWAAFRPLNISPQLDPLVHAASDSYERVRGTISSEMSRSRGEAEQRGRMLREETTRGISNGLATISQTSQALREEVTKQVSTFADTIGNSLSGLGAAQTEKLDGVVQQVRSLAEANERRLVEMRTEGQESGKALRYEVTKQMGAFAETLSTSLSNLGTAQTEKLDNVVQQVRSLGEANERRLLEMRNEGQESGKALRDEVTVQLKTLGEVLGKNLATGAETQRERLEGIANEIHNLTRRSTEQSETLRQVVEAKLTSLREENSAKLEEMRLTVDEKLQNSLEQRLSTSFKIVSDQLEQVFKSVGEMQTLATGVGDLKRVLTNVKNRGTWAEVSLGNLLEQIMAPEQFERGVEVRPGSGERVDFAIKLPGAGSDGPVWLPIDAKFPSEDYERLVEASERGDSVGIENALKGIEQRIRLEGASVGKKYICPPHTTDFAILYLPTEGLYAEVIRRHGLVDELQRSCRIVVAGPTVLLATLNSLRMGFRTLAIQKRSSEVWELLSAVKTEFSKYGTVLDKVQKKLTEASNQIELVARRKRAIDRRLRGVEEAADSQVEQLLQLNELSEGDLVDDHDSDEDDLLASQSVALPSLS
ncbi:DNA recombination protein RmuC [Bradyrhizobium sp. Rc2d]|uniref:DNA recombination protein RmuC n=1 Tax=Bradyrhizobium sp. Rc2d TaxID=1855321 RepID=UPI001AEC83B1|nr:DNA recombination protein RmuC [Bradyrhizobium sp. Rc2d]